MERLFIQTWPMLWTILPRAQGDTGSRHSIADLVMLKGKLKAVNGVEIDWDMPVSSLRKLREQIKV
jgi:hypothetical protein